MIDLEPVTYKDMEFLYDLLEERTSRMNISHHKMPSWDDHIKFWDTCQYKEAYIITYYNRPRGMAYMTRKNEIGIFIKKEYKFQGIGTKALLMMLSKNKGKRILANVNPRNGDSIDFFEKMGFKHIQNTYEYVPK